MLQINDFQGQEDGAVQLENKQGFVLLPLLIWVITDFGFQPTVKESMRFLCVLRIVVPIKSLQDFVPVN